MSSIIDKHNRINQLKCPKIIFAGGSNLAFGLDSELIEREFNVPVVNLGLHAGLGLDFIFNELKDVVHQNDIVILSIEYFLDNEGYYDLKRFTGSKFKEAKLYYKFDIRKEIITDIDKTRMDLKSYNIKEIPNTEKGIYSRNAFNNYGDHIAHLEQDLPKKLGDRGSFKYKYWDGIKIINDFYDYVKFKNVTVYFIYPNYPKSEYLRNNTVINKLAIDLSRNLNIDILNNPSDFVFEDSLFFDTVYHLNKNGRKKRTQKLIEIINQNQNAINKIISIKNDSLEKLNNY